MFRGSHHSVISLRMRLKAFLLYNSPMFPIGGPQFCITGFARGMSVTVKRFVILYSNDSESRNHVNIASMAPLINTIDISLRPLDLSIGIGLIHNVVPWVRGRCVSTGRVTPLTGFFCIVVESPMKNPIVYHVEICLCIRCKKATSATILKDAHHCGNVSGSTCMRGEVIF